MNILMLTEYFYPFAHGGTEWSVYYLAKELKKRGHIIFIATPRYGASQKEEWKGVTILRFPFYRHSRKPQNLSPFWHNNLFIWLVNSLYIFYYCLKYSIHTIHVQSKSYIIPTVIIKFFLWRPVFQTLRDYFILCPYGLCISEENHYKKCSLGQFYKRELPEYIDRYIENKTIFTYIFHLISSLNARLTSSLLRFSLQFFDKVICISKKQQKIYKINGIPNTEMIYNVMEFTIPSIQKSGDYILFVGRVTPGKGVDIYVEACAELIEEKSIKKAYIVGEGFLKKILQNKIKQEGIPRIVFLSQLSYGKTLELIKRALLVVVPSRWEEPFGRVALEALSFGVPVVVSNRGGLPEIIDSLNVGCIVEPRVMCLKEGIKKVFTKNLRLRRNIKKHYSILKNRFHDNPIEKHLGLYEAYN